MVVLLVGMAVAAIWMSALLPAWRHQAQRQKEEELIFIGEQYARAIVLYQFKNQGAFPPNIEALVSGHYLRKQWKDPLTGEEFGVVGPNMPQQTGPAPSTPQTPGRAGQPQQPGRAGGPAQPQMLAGISGVRSKSKATSIKIYKNLQQHDLWPFDAQQMYLVMGNPLQRGQGPGRGGQPQTPGRGGPVQGGPGPGGPAGGPVGAPGRGGDGRGAPATPLPPGRGGGRGG